jgi:hypothetical protein
MVYTSARAKPTPRFLLAVAALTFLSTLLFGCTNSHVTPSTQLTPASIDPHEKPASPAARAAILVRCPSLNPSGAPVTLQSKGGHRVILSWRASAPSNLKHSAAIGYCIYRSTPRKNSPPVLLNSIPFAGTSCTDDLVESGKKYYYVVRAISARSVISTTSNIAPAPIPQRTLADPYVSKSSAPLCREATKK